MKRFWKTYGDLFVVLAIIGVIIGAIYGVIAYSRHRTHMEAVYLVEHNCKQVGSVGDVFSRTSAFRCDNGAMTRNDILDEMDK